jgi:hypothetical protein
MATTQQDIKRRVERAPEGTKWMLVICDSYDYSDYPVYFSDSTKCLAEIKSARNGEDMKKLMECYDLSLPLWEQMNERRAMHPPKES